MTAAATKFESFCVDPTERWIFAGNASGQISVIDVDRFEVCQAVQAHLGIVQAISCHQHAPFVAALSTDRQVTVWRYDEGPDLAPVCTVSLRSVRPDNDDEHVAFVHSTSQAIGFHDRELRVVTRSANAGLLEFEFDEAGVVRIISCRRVHGEADLISARYAKDSDDVLSGSIDGQLVLSRRGTVLRRWELGDAVVHWAEHVAGDSYLLASDMRFVARVDIRAEGRPIVGPQFTRDDLEHVTYSRRSHRAFVGSFDRNIYEIDPETCVPNRIAFRAPFKCRWVKTLEREPAMAIVQCRNGGLYKVDIDAAASVRELKSTPAALWTCVTEPEGSLLLAGEGDALLRLRPGAVDPVARTPAYHKETVELHLHDGSYTKRAALHPGTRELYLARTSGCVYSVGDRSARLVVQLPSAIRDLALDGTGDHLFVACEDGTAHRIDSRSGETRASFSSRKGEPLWSLAYNPNRDLLAVAERSGTLTVLAATDFTERFRGIPTGRPKRMKWVDADLLLYNFRDELRSFSIATGVRQVRVESVGNTIEDFIWDPELRYLVLVSYTQNVYLCDFGSGELINAVPDQIDYSKGLAWAPPVDDAYPLDFVTFGRSGTAHRFRVHDEKIVALGAV